MDDGFFDTADEIADVAFGWYHVDRNRLLGVDVRFSLMAILIEYALEILCEED